MSPAIIGIVGYKNSGKTTLTRALARELTGRDYHVAVVKHTHHLVDPAGTDTATLGEVVDQVALISPQESAVFWKKPLSLEDVIPHLEAEIILVEGFKQEQGYPKIVCLRGEPDDRDLFDGLVLCAVGPAAVLGAYRFTEWLGKGVPFLSWDEVHRIADLVEQAIGVGRE